MKLIGNDQLGHVEIPSPCYCSWCDDYICNKNTPWSRCTLYFRSGEDWIKGFFCSRLCLRSAEEDDYLGEVYWRREYKNAPSCFITTAICSQENKPDDCEELEILRSFRDSYMMQDEVRTLDVRTYYHLAPQIVQQLDATNSGQLYEMLKSRWLHPAISCIKRGENDQAYTLYSDMMHFLINKYEDLLNTNGIDKPPVSQEER